MREEKYAINSKIPSPKKLNKAEKRQAKQEFCIK